MMLAAFQNFGNNPALPKRRDFTNNYPNLTKFTKWLLHDLSVLFSCLGLGSSTYGQGTLVFNNLGANDGKVSLFDAIGTQTPLNQDLNFSPELVTGGETTPLRNWFLRDGTAKGINVGPGLFADPAHSTILLPEFVPGASVNVLVAAWAGDYPTWMAAASAGAPAALSLRFSVRLGSVDAPPASLGENFPGLAVGVIPEPRIFTLAIVGMAIFFLDSTKGRSRAKSALKKQERRGQEPAEKAPLPRVQALRL